MVPDNNQFLSQEEIDALLKATAGESTREEELGVGQGAEEVAATAAPVLEEGAGEEVEGNPEPAPAEAADTISTAGGEPLTACCRPAVALTPEERDALGEIGNISMGSAATTLSELLNRKVTITSPRVLTCTQEEFFAGFKVPYVIIQVEFKEGLKGFNVLIIQLRDAMIMADLMMGGDGTNVAEQISELELSAASEAMNQMIGTASTSLATIFRRTINISPPQTTVLEVSGGKTAYRLPTEDPIVVVSFKMTIGDLVDTEIMQIMSLETAREEAAILLEQLTAETTAPALEPATGKEEAVPPPEPPAMAAQAAPPPARAAGEPPAGGGRRSRATLSEEEQRK
ncbi:flagellar motor switch phosphatase FliY, partial [Desulfofundulus sp.]|uniref:flagellar motor switch phosphatase FliY n=1 Tax=Desulfofundulus sp. TaxID=2282750 RepID=UPI003C75C269